MQDCRTSTDRKELDRLWETNRRAFPRWPAQLEIRFGTGKQMTAGETIEIGEGGLAFFTDQALSLDSELDIEYRLQAGDCEPNNEWVKLKTIVRHVKDGKVGVEFLNLRRNDRLKILDFITAKKYPIKSKT